MSTPSKFAKCRECGSVLTVREEVRGKKYCQNCQAVLRLAESVGSGSRRSERLRSHYNDVVTHTLKDEKIRKLLSKRKDKSVEETKPKHDKVKDNKSKGQQEKDKNIISKKEKGKNTKSKKDKKNKSKHQHKKK